MADTIPLIIVYDIRNPSRWRKLHKLLAANAFALQYSVFAADWSEKQLIQMEAAFKSILNAKEDDLRIFRIPSRPQGYRLGNWRGTAGLVLALGSPVLNALEQLKTTKIPPRKNKNKS